MKKLIGTLITCAFLASCSPKVTINSPHTEKPVKVKTPRKRVANPQETRILFAAALVGAVLGNHFLTEDNE